MLNRPHTGHDTVVVLKESVTRDKWKTERDKHRESATKAQPEPDINWIQRDTAYFGTEILDDFSVRNDDHRGDIKPEEHDLVSQ